MKRLTLCLLAITLIMSSAMPTSNAAEYEYTEDSAVYMTNVPRGVKENDTRHLTMNISFPHQRMNYALQIKTKGKWRTINKRNNVEVPAQTNVTTHKFKVKFPAKPGTYTYRALVTNVDNGQETTETFNVQVLKQKQYSKYIKKAQKHIKKYCPATPIFTQNSVYGPYHYNSMTFTDDMVFSVSKGLTNKELKNTSLRSCATLLQSSINKYAPDYQKDEYNQRGTKVYKSKKNWTNIEADCMTLIMKRTKKDKTNSHATTCTPKQFKNAKKTIKIGMKNLRKHTY